MSLWQPSKSRRHRNSTESSFFGFVTNFGRRLQGARVVILSGPRVWHRSTCATLIASGANVVGICVADQRSAGLPLRYIWKSARRTGAFSVLSQIAGRALYRVLNGARDAAHLKEL